MENLGMVGHLISRLKRLSREESLWDRYTGKLLYNYIVIGTNIGTMLELNSYSYLGLDVGDKATYRGSPFRISILHFNSNPVQQSPWSHTSPTRDIPAQAVILYQKSGQQKRALELLVLEWQDHPMTKGAETRWFVWLLRRQTWYHPT